MQARMAHFYRKQPAGFFLLMLLIFMKSNHVSRSAAYSTRSLLDEERRPLRLNLALTRLFTPHAGNFSYAHMQQALHRSSLRLARFHYMLQLNGSAAAAASLSSSPPANYKAPVNIDHSTGAEFLSTLSIGTPPVSFNAVVDTGSDLVWLQCKPCSACFTNQGHNSTIFDPLLSSTYTMLPCSSPMCNYIKNGCGIGTTTSSCSYTYSYGDKSQTNGDLSLDTLTLPDPSGAPQSIPNFTFGCGHDNEFSSSIGEGDGIVGLALGPLSLPSQLGVSHLSYCLQSITAPISKPSALILGEVAEAAPPSTKGRTLTTQFFRNPVFPQRLAFYYVKLNGISVGGQLVAATSEGAFDIQYSDGSGGMVFDSGTTFTMLRSDAYNAVVGAFKAAIALSPAPANAETASLCYELSAASNIQLPSLTFHFEGADLEMPLANYFLPLEDKNLICLALIASPGSYSNHQPISIFGNIQQQNFFIDYDLQAQTLSLTPTTTCDF